MCRLENDQWPDQEEMSVQLMDLSASVGFTPTLPTPTPREVISSKEKSKYKFPPTALPCEFGAFFQGQAPPSPASKLRSPSCSSPMPSARQELLGGLA